MNLYTIILLWFALFAPFAWLSIGITNCRSMKYRAFMIWRWSQRELYYVDVQISLSLLIYVLVTYAHLCFVDAWSLSFIDRFILSAAD